MFDSRKKKLKTGSAAHSALYPKDTRKYSAGV
jgi:hypothetical protein